MGSKQHHPESGRPGGLEKKTYRKSRTLWTSILSALILLGLLGFWSGKDPRTTLLGSWGHFSQHKSERLVHGGRWRVMFVCNGESPCPTLYAEEGDIVEMTVKNDIYAQSSFHWSGIGHKTTGSWNDGVAGVSQFPILPRGNFTSVIDTAGSWGLNWYAEHTTAASADGLYGMVYVAPSPSRPRPYRFITTDDIELRKIMEAEKEIRHLAIKNHQHRDTGWKMLRMRAEGSEFYCYDSLIVNGKGRVHCRQPGFERLNGHDLDETGCIQPQGLPAETCTPSNADYEVIETGGRSYVMLNLINIGFEHEVMASIDNHKMVVVANNGGFVTPEETDAVYIPSAGRVTVLVKLDALPGDYALRLSSTSQLQNLQGYSILRYPASRRPIYGQPMQLPQPESADDICVLPDGTAKHGCKTLNGQFLAPYPPSPPPRAKKSRPASADFTFRLAAGSQPSQTEAHVPEYYLNEKPWQLFRSSLMPLLFQDLNATAESLGKPVIDGIPVGSVVDLIIENELNDTIPLYKHADPAWLLGVGSNAKFPYASVEQAVSKDKNMASSLNLLDPGLVVVHDLPPLGWSVLRFKVTAKAATMIHAVKLRYFALGMSAPIMEGILPNDPVDFPTSAVNRPHVEFEPKNDGVFG
ncbi:Laccase abr2 [Colletotrichum orbiculare MAFF 240422]|uniref:Laccase abr2 n=1 Tax=Colletotrichum orbiculare (strain 104-T / ATCC 96160 / CBS 514.97 / LARS 414 / MAFF 240422) TaxID=1213857 RepID=A0A484FAB5_COLOR|nr:Laccase abr2 [Colletotrichum orbiculare MAFF 240422]